MTIQRNGSKTTPPIGVLLMAYGGPESLAEIPGYLADIRSGRPTPRHILDEITNNYRLIGGKSPLLAQTRHQKEALEARFDPHRYRFFLGMRHWAPWLEDTICEMLEAGIQRSVSVVLAPHYSRLSIAKYQEKISAGLEMYHGQIDFTHVNSYHTAPGLIEALANRVAEGIQRWPIGQQPDVHVVFSAHSLPARIQAMNDPYPQQLLETAQLVATRAGLSESRWSWSYQSAGRSPEPWLGPQLPEHLERLAGQGIRDLVSVPVGFVTDHVEILFDIDIQAQETARRLGIRLERPPALNDDPLFIDALEQTIRAQVAAKGWS